MLQNIQKYNKYLSRLGLNPSQTKLYLACLELGEATAGQIAKHANIHRVNSYDIANSLVKLGLLEKTTKGKTTYLIAANPKELIALADKQRNEISKTKWKIVDLVPELEAIYSTSSLARPKIRYYEGAKNYYRIQDEALEEKEIWYLGSLSDIYEIINPDKDLEFIRKRVKKNINTKILLNKKDQDTTLAQQLIKNQNKNLRHIKFFKQITPYPLKGLMMITGNKVVWFNSKQELIIVIIESKEIVDMQRNFFTYLWENN